MKNNEVFTDKSLMPFGKYKDKPLIEVPATYLVWLYRVNFNNKLNFGASPLNVYLHENIDVLRKQ